MFRRTFIFLLASQLTYYSSASSLSKRYNLGPLDKGTQFETLDRSITLEILAANFCGNEKLNNVAKRSNPSKTYSTDITSYLEELRKASPQVRKKMVLNNLEKVKNAANATERGENANTAINRQLLAMSPEQRAWINTAFKFSAETFYLALVARGVLGNYNSTETITYAEYGGGFLAILAKTVLLNILYEIYGDVFDRYLPQDLYNLDQWKALALTILAQALDVELIIQHQEPENKVRRGEVTCSLNTIVLEPFVDQLQNFDGGDQMPIRPFADCQAIQSNPHPNACPNAFVEIGNGGSTGT